LNFNKKFLKLQVQEITKKIKCSPGRVDSDACTSTKLALAKNLFIQNETLTQKTALQNHE
jgi:hypothetical protein